MGHNSQSNVCTGLCQINMDQILSNISVQMGLRHYNAGPYFARDVCMYCIAS